MRPPLLLTGPPAAGKSTTAMQLITSARRGAVVDVDDVRQLVVVGHAAPWEGGGGRLQQRVGVANACDLARRFLSVGIEVILTDVVTPTTADLYRWQLPNLQIVRLRLPIGQARRRAQLRPMHITEQEFDDLHALDADSNLHVDHVIDVGHLDVEAQTEAVRAVWSSSGAGGSKV
jgi:predicted kinase